MNKTIRTATSWIATAAITVVLSFGAVNIMHHATPGTPLAASSTPTTATTKASPAVTAGGTVPVVLPAGISAVDDGSFTGSKTFRGSDN